MKKQILVSLAAVLFAVLSVRSQETNEEVVGRFENEQIVLTKVVALADHFRSHLDNDGKLSELTATLLPDQKHVYIGTTVKGSSEKISGIGIIALLHEGKVYVLSGKSTLAKSMDMNGLGSPTISCKGEACTACAVSFTDIISSTDLKARQPDFYSACLPDTFSVGKIAFLSNFWRFPQLFEIIEYQIVKKIFQILTK